MKIRDFCKLNINTYSENEHWKEINYLDTGSIVENRITEIQRFVVNQDEIPSRARRKVEIDDVIYSTVRPNQRHYGIIKHLIPNMLVSTGFSVISIDKRIANPDYIYCFLTTDNIVNALQTIGEQSTSAYPSIRPSDIESLDIYLPSLAAQEKISKVLMTIEKKIENNEKINNNLSNHSAIVA